MTSSHLSRQAFRQRRQDKRDRAIVERYGRNWRNAIAWFREQGKPLEIERLEMRTNNDLEMLEDLGTATASRITAGISREGRPGNGPMFCWIISPRISSYSSTNPTHRFRSLRGMYRGDPVPQGILSFNMDSASRRHWTTAL